MLRLLSIKSPAVYVFLLLCIIVMRLPAFHPGYFATDESFYILSGQKIAAGGLQYIDTIDNKPPVLGWFYALFVWIFNGNALTAIRVFTVLYLFGACLLFNELIHNTRMIPSFSVLPGFLFAVLSCTPWYAAELNGEMLMLIPLLLAFGLLMRLNVGETRNPEYRLFQAGLLLGLSVMIKYQAVFLFLGFFIAYLIILPPRLREIISFLSGFIVAIAILLLAVYFTGAFPEFWKLGVLYNFDYLRIGVNPGEQSGMHSGLSSALQLWGGFALAAAAGVLFFRTHYYKLPILLRKTETIFLAWLISGIAAVLAGGSRLYLHYFIFLFPAIAAYASRFFMPERKRTFIPLLFYASLILPLLFMVQGFYCMAPARLGILRALIRDDGWTAKMAQTMNRPHILKHHIPAQAAKEGILVLNYQPELYMRLNAPCASPYTNFGIAYYRMGIFPGTENLGLLSGSEPLTAVFEKFHDHMPAVIIDSWEENDLGEIFPVLKSKFPLLFSGYRGITAGKNRVYIRD